MDISDSHRPEQEELFYSLAPKMFGDAVLVSHAIVRQWDSDNPMTLSAAGLGRLRKRLPDTLPVSDDMQMQGLQKAMIVQGRHGYALQSVRPGAGDGRHRRIHRRVSATVSCRGQRLENRSPG
jgi:beta-N-acetylhexosaminidase